MADVAQPGGRGDVLEGNVPPVVEQHVATPGGGHKQVGPAVVVVVRERGSNGNPLADGHSCFGGDVDKRPVTQRYDTARSARAG